jgi:hypothetical protein
MLVFDQSSQLANLVEIRLAKKFSVATQSVHAKICIGMHRGHILNFKNTFDRACDETRMEKQTENFFASLISTRLAN